jgi:hypothetical protein
MVGEFAITVFFSKAISGQSTFAVCRTTTFAGDMDSWGEPISVDAARLAHTLSGNPDFIGGSRVKVSKQAQNNVKCHSQH